MDMNPLQSGCRTLKVNKLILPSGVPLAAWTPNWKEGVCLRSTSCHSYSSFWHVHTLLPPLSSASITLLAQKTLGPGRSLKNSLISSSLGSHVPSQQGPGPPPSVIPRPPICTHQDPLPELPILPSFPILISTALHLHHMAYLLIMPFVSCLSPSRETCSTGRSLCFVG